MSTTLKALRQAIGNDLNEIYVDTGTSDTTNGSATKVTCLAAIDKYYDSSVLVSHGWIKDVTASNSGDIRRIAAYVNTTGVITFSRAMSQTSQTMNFEIHTLMSPTDMDRCINNGLARCYYLDEFRFMQVGSYTHYDLSRWPFISKKEQIYDVLWRVGEANEWEYVTLPWWEVLDDMALSGIPVLSGNSTYSGTSDAVAPGGYTYPMSVLSDGTATWTVDALIGYTVQNVSDGSEGIITDNTATIITATLAGGTENHWDAGDTYNIFRDSFAVRCLRPYVALTSDTDTTLCPTAYCYPAAKLEVFKFLTMSGTKDDTARYEGQQKKALGEWEQAARQYHPRPPRRALRGIPVQGKVNSDVVTW